MQVAIDTGRCQGHGRCYDLLPEVFGADDEGYATVAGDGAVPGHLAARGRLAAANCPENAVMITEEG
ncbi:MAG TPA: ferredoxin [Acidimicrobiales bacterium]|nr:ferredoxin [Acidimicrobiales bacterium]